MCSAAGPDPVDVARATRDRAATRAAVLGLAWAWLIAVVILALAAPLGAQDGTEARSDVRVPVSKRSAGEVERVPAAYLTPSALPAPAFVAGRIVFPTSEVRAPDRARRRFGWLLPLALVPLGALAVAGGQDAARVPVVVVAPVAPPQVVPEPPPVVLVLAPLVLGGIVAACGWASRTSRGRDHA